MEVYRAYLSPPVSARQMSRRLYNMPSVSPPGVHSMSPAGAIALFHRKASKWWPPASNQASHLLKIFFDSRHDDARLEILPIFFSTTASFLANNMENKRPQSAGISAIRHIHLLRQHRSWLCVPWHYSTWSNRSFIFLSIRWRTWPQLAERRGRNLLFLGKTRTLWFCAQS